MSVVSSFVYGSPRYVQVFSPSELVELPEDAVYTADAYGRMGAWAVGGDVFGYTFGSASIDGFAYELQTWHKPASGAFTTATIIVIGGGRNGQDGSNSQVGKGGDAGARHVWVGPLSALRDVEHVLVARPGGGPSMMSRSGGYPSGLGHQGADSLCFVGNGTPFEGDTRLDQGPWAMGGKLYEDGGIGAGIDLATHNGFPADASAGGGPGELGGAPGSRTGGAGGYGDTVIGREAPEGGAGNGSPGDNGSPEHGQRGGGGGGGVPQATGETTAGNGGPGGYPGGGGGAGGSRNTVGVTGGAGGVGAGGAVVVICT